MANSEHQLLMLRNAVWPRTPIRGYDDVDELDERKHEMVRERGIERERECVSAREHGVNNVRARLQQH